jgi:uncharacterized membrane protein
MLEILAIKGLNDVYKNLKLSKYDKVKKESFKNDKNNDEDNALQLWILFILFIFMLPFSIVAVYYSWTSNSLIEWDNFSKFVFAFFAFFWPIIYLINHLLHKVDLLNAIRRYKTF